MRKGTYPVDDTVDSLADGRLGGGRGVVESRHDEVLSYWLG